MKKNIFDLAAQISFYALLSLIPLVMLMASLTGFILGNTQGVVEEMARGILDVIPLVQEEFTANVRSLLEQRHSLGIVGIFFLLSIATMLVASIERAFDTIFQSVHRRNFFHSRLVGILLIFTISLLFFVPTMAEILEGALSRFGFHFPLIAMVQGKAYFLLVSFLSYVVTALVIPNHKVFLRYAACGGVIFAGGIALAKFLFRWYMVVAFTRYNIIYGSLTAVVLFVVWIYYVSVILLMATEAAAVLQLRRVFHRRKTDINH